MKNSSETSGYFGLPCGVEFPKQVVHGLVTRLKGQSPLELANTRIIVNTSRMRREILRAFDGGTATFLPKIHTLADIECLLPAPLDIARQSSLQLRLYLRPLVAAFLRRDARFASDNSAFELADSLAGLLAEMCEEGVSAADIAALDIPNASGHWDHALTFLKIALNITDDDALTSSVPEMRLSLAVSALEEKWRLNPLPALAAQQHA